MKDGKKDYRGILIEHTDTRRSLLEVLQDRGAYLAAPCGGNGSCGKCKVRFTGNIPSPSDADVRLLSRREIEDGVRLACTAPVQEGAEVEISADDESDMAAAGGFSIRTGTGKENRKAEAYAEEGASVLNGTLAAAVDIGTTTLAMSSVDLSEGRVVSTVTGVNHQRAFGADVISRIAASVQGKGGQLQKAILRDLDSLREQLGLPGNTPMVISGNTTMQHLLQGLPCKSLGVFPFTPEDISLHSCGTMTFLPGISTFVGADIVSGIAACGIDRSDELCVLVDLGTNGEMAVGRRGRILCASAAAGPAFEGGHISCGSAGIPGAVSGVEIRDGKVSLKTIGGLPPAGLCGTGVVEAVYELLKAGLIDETGLLDEDHFEDGFTLADGIVITGKDIREVQLAKSAVRAGLEVLLKTYGADFGHIGRVYLAGGFGQKINLKKAAGIGLLPEELLDRTTAVGNSSLAGAVMAACDPAVPERMKETAGTASEISLSDSPLFGELFMDYMFFPEL